MDDTPIQTQRADQLIARIRAAHLTYCGPPKLENLAALIQEVTASKVAGDVIEAGVALGGSAILLALLKPQTARLTLYDVFEMIPAPGENDGPDAHARYEVIRSGASAGLGDQTYYGYVENLQDQVQRNLETFGVDLARDRVALERGLFQDTLHPAGPVSFAHIDCDWYDSVRTCIERIVPRLSPGGILVFDDYNSYSGCRRAVDELRAERPDFAVAIEARSLALRRT
jgi:predicted O-methyltransferase YrrM